MKAFLINLGLFCVGCWEMNFLVQHKVTAYSSHTFIHGYVYTLVASVTNLITGILFSLHRKHKHNEFSILSMWSILWFIGVFDDDIRTGPFQPVVIAQVVISIVGSLLCCVGLACVGKQMIEYKPDELV